MSRVPFIPPAIPRLRPSPPAGEAWLHEVKLDSRGYRVEADAPYRSGTRSGWNKVKTQEWKKANRYLAKLFEKG